MNDDIGELQPLLTKKQAAEQLQMCQRNLELLVNKKAISVVRFAKRCVRFRPEDIAAFIESRRIPATHESL